MAELVGLARRERWQTGQRRILPTTLRTRYDPVKQLLFRKAPDSGDQGNKKEKAQIVSIALCVIRWKIAKLTDGRQEEEEEISESECSFDTSHIQINRGVARLSR